MCFKGIEVYRGLGANGKHKAFLASAESGAPSSGEARVQACQHLSCSGDSLLGNAAQWHELGKHLETFRKILIIFRLLEG